MTAPHPDRPGDGLFLVLEGLDGAGTTTQGEIVVDALSRGEGRAVLEREPSGGPIGALIRQALTHRVADLGGDAHGLETMALLFAADRLDHLAHAILPRLAAGVHVVCDRYYASTLAYELDEDRTRLPWLRRINARARRPDLTLYLDVPVEVCVERRHAAGRSEELLEAEAFQRRVAAQYDAVLDFLEEEGETIERIDGDAPPDVVTARIRAAVGRHFPGILPDSSDEAPAP